MTDFAIVSQLRHNVMNFTCFPAAKGDTSSSGKPTIIFVTILVKNSSKKNIADDLVFCCQILLPVVTSSKRLELEVWANYEMTELNFLSQCQKRGEGTPP